MIFSRLLLPPTTGTAAADRARQQREKTMERKRKQGLLSWREKWAKRARKMARLAKETDQVCGSITEESITNW